MRESMDKNKFIFEQIENTSGHKVLMVPDQFTLQSELNAFEYLKKDAIIDLEILSPSRLGSKIVKETGQIEDILLDKYGRQMLLFRIIKKNIEKLKHFSKMADKSAFIDMINIQLGEFAQYYIDSTALKDMVAKVDKTSILYQKLTDLITIYEAYEQEISGKYIDTLDINDLYIQRAKISNFITECTFWVLGFDYMAPKNLGFLMQIVSRSKNVNIILTGDESPNIRDSQLFDITKKFVYKLKNNCKEIGANCSISQVTDEKYIDSQKSPAAKIIEKELFSYPCSELKDSYEDLNLCHSKNAYTQADLAASYIRELIATKGYRFNDFAVICNDIEGSGSIIKRTFAEHGINLFLDQPRDILHNPLISLVLNLLRIANSKLLSNYIISFLKSGFSDLTRDEIEKLENYAKKYKINGNMWLKDFYKIDKNSKTEIPLADINRLRERAVAPIIVFREKMKNLNTATQKIKALYSFISSDLNILEKIDKKINLQEKSGLTEQAQENAQIWNIMLKLFEQFALILGDDDISNESMEEILKAGFSSLEIGMIPASSDLVLIGSMQRSRIGKIRCLVVLSANDGILPFSATSDSIITNDEKNLIFQDMGLEIGELNSSKLLEENLAIYRMLTSPKEELFMCFQETSLKGDSLKPSQVFLRLCDIFKNNKVSSDAFAFKHPFGIPLVPSRSLRHIGSKLRSEKKLSSAEKLVLSWHAKNNSSYYKAFVAGIKFNVNAKRLNTSDTKTLYSIDTSLKLSPSRLERYAKCPFAYFIEYGIRPDKQSAYELSGRDFGDIYHEAAQHVSERLSSDKNPISSASSLWQTISPEDLNALIEQIVSEEISSYQNGMLFDENYGEYKRLRIIEVCKQVIHAICKQVRLGKIDSMLCEVKFGNSKDAMLSPINIDSDFPITIEGKIDRIDIIKGSEHDYCKVIDYKSGNTSFDKEAVAAGFQLQLPIYLKAAASASENTKAGGMFYFKFANATISLANGDSVSSLDDDLQKKFKLDGIFLDSLEFINGLDKDFERYSSVASISKVSGEIKKNDSYMLKDSQFNEFLSSTSSVIYRLCKELSSGNISIHPGKIKGFCACDYCDFSSICKFDKNFSGCNYRRK